MFELKNVYKYYHNAGVTNKGLLNVNLSLEKNEIVVITGESGSGKSTLLNVITKQDTFDEGEIYYYGNETSYFSIDDMDNFRKNKIGFIFQNYNIIDSYTVLENVMLPLIINDVPYKEAKKEAFEIIKKVGLEKWANNRGTKLSGGQKQRCVIARALASRCEILACDEPTGNLDSQTGNEIVELIKEVAKDKLVLIVTHNYEQFAPIATRKIKVHDGEIIEDTYITKPDKDENKTLELDYVPVNNKTNSRIAFNNLKSTPRKTFLMCLITLFTAFFAFYLYQASYSVITNGYKENPFAYQGTNKIVVYEKNHNTLDLTKFSDYNYVVNPTSMESDDSFIFDLTNSTNTSGVSFYANYESQMPKKYNLKFGNLPKSDGEVLLIVPSDSTDDFMISRFNNDGFTTLKVRSSAADISEDPNLDFSNRYLYFNLTGIAYSSSVKSNVVVPATAKDNERLRLFSLLENKSSNFPILLDLNQSTKFILKNADKYESIKNDNDYFYYYIDSNHTLFKNTIPYSVNTEMKYEGVLVLGNDVSEYENVYEISLYGNKKNIKKVATKAGYQYLDVSKYDVSTALIRLIYNLLSYVSLVSQSITILIIYLIASIILLKVFTSKLETYAIFRTLGVTKKDMKKILYIEVFMTVMAMTFVNLFISIVIGRLNVSNSFVNLYKHMVPQIIIFYILIMLFISYLLARKFNKKLFKSSVSKTLREEE